MIKNLSKKSKIAFSIRIFCLFSVTIVYLCVSLKSSNDFIKSSDKIRNRKILNILNDEEGQAEPEQVENQGVNDDFDSLVKIQNENFVTNIMEKELIKNSKISATSEPSINFTNYLENLQNISVRNCTPPSIFEFPPDGLNRSQRQKGWIVLHLVSACYCFWLLAIVCDDYFVPAIGIMCKKFKMKEDVCGATFMAAATSSPELFINCVGTFITEGDLGIGTVVGSAVFNVLAVPACCGLFAGKVVDLDWWPLSRDALMYAFSVIALIITLYDGKVMWYEALILVLAYSLYITAMYCNDWIARKARWMVCKIKRRRKRTSYRPFREVNEISPLISKDIVQSKKTEAENSIEINTNNNNNNEINSKLHLDEDEEDLDFAGTPWSIGDDNIFVFLFRWPITFLLWITMPDCRKYPNLRFMTFAICILWIGIVSYIVAFLITVVGDTVNIPDSVMGLTFLAAGTSIPEAVSSVIVTNQGHGGMGISNSIGSNTFDILLCLGFPWLIKSLAAPTVPGNLWVTINSSGLTYSVISLLSTLCGLYIAFALNKFRMDWKVGLTCLIMYIAFLIFASLVELNVFFPVNIPTCAH